jgi:hypothetical protein
VDGLHDSLFLPTPDTLLADMHRDAKPGPMSGLGGKQAATITLDPRVSCRGTPLVTHLCCLNNPFVFYKLSLYCCCEIVFLDERKFSPSEVESASFGAIADDLHMPSLPAGDELVVRRENSLDTRSQSDRRARADAGDLQARLDLIPLSVVEDQLSRCFRTANPECSILSSLRSGDGAAAGHEAAATILEELADSTEQAALTSTLVYRYIQAHSLWRGHPDAKVTSAESFLDTLDNADYVKANIVIGSSADLSKQRSLKAIESKWGADWFCKIPNELRDPR